MTEGTEYPRGPVEFAQAPEFFMLANRQGDGRCVVWAANAIDMAAVQQNRAGFGVQAQCQWFAWGAGATWREALANLMETWDPDDGDPRDAPPTFHPELKGPQ